MIEASFREEMARAGLVPHEPPLADGRLHRFHVTGDKQGTKNGWYVLHGDSTPTGVFGSWKHGIHQTWSLKPQRSMTSTEKAAYRRKINIAEKAREAEHKEKQEAIRQKANFIWKTIETAPNNHPYLLKKKVGNHGLRLSKHDSLVIPLRDENGTLHSLQFINADGKKMFLAGGKKSGCYFPIGKVTNILCICEGYATAASVYESTGYATACAFDAGNLKSVAKVLRHKFPDTKIILCADDDANTVGNPGLAYAQAAAKVVNGSLAVAGRMP